MKKAIFLALGVIVALSALFVSCADGDNEGGGNNDLFCNVSVTKTAGGSVSITDYLDNSSKVLIGATIEVVAVPESGYDFLGWFVGNSEEPVSTNATFKFVASRDVALLAKFEKTFMVSVQSAGTGGVAIKDISDKSLELLIGSELTVIATPDADCDFLGWFVDDAETPVSTEATYTFTVEEEVSLVAKFEIRKTYIDGYEYVDLGLPSGIKWAAYNVGATKPEEYGGYYAWGETEEKENYQWSTYKWCTYIYGTYKKTKYCTDSSYGTVDNKTVLDPEDDVAHVKWGGGWRMPTKAEQDELLNNCDWDRTTLNGVKGFRVTGPNGNSIFLPRAGLRDGTDSWMSWGYCWSSSLSDSETFNLSFDFSTGECTVRGQSCYRGLSVRPVCK